MSTGKELHEPLELRNNVSESALADFYNPSVPLLCTSQWDWSRIKPLEKSRGNWKEWRHYVFCALSHNGLWDYTRPDCTPPNPAIEPCAHAHWVQNDRRVCAFLCAGSSAYEMQVVVPRERGAAEYWRLLKERHTKGGPMEQLYLLLDALAVRAENEESYPAALAKGFDYVDRVSDMGPVDTDLFKQAITVHMLRERPYDQFALLEDIRRGYDTNAPFTGEHIMRFAEDRDQYRRLRAAHPTSSTTAKNRRRRAARRR
ncbi:hypothetical protein CVT25_002709 [Psilocybe cyanescens]|uniref:Uncharacterized protein n=1 Tax=Psilocybe cyanescens TaxID=93625 RepID=A0A409WLP1_PSICY|nr:hypothetical protein CVT25_002709 [Psilocybe cyanescens]